MNETQLFILLQVNDAVFPIGGYSHSYGLETYIQRDLVKNADQALDFLKSNIRNAFLYSELLPAKLAYQYAKANDLNQIFALEELVEASKSPFEVRSAAQKLGSRFVKTVQSMGVEYQNDVFTRYAKIEQPTYAIAYGVFCASIGIELRRALESFLYTNTSGKVISCVKTIPLSQTAGQQILKECHKTFTEVLDLLEDATEAEVCRSTPGFDVRCMQHETLYSRIYMS